MRVDWTKNIEGVPMKFVRDMLRDLGRYSDSHSSETIVKFTRRMIVRLGRQFAGHMIGAERLGYSRRPSLSFGIGFILEMVACGSAKIVFAGEIWTPSRIDRVSEAMPNALVAEGLLRPLRGAMEGGRYGVTDKGVGLRCAPKVARFDRARADRYIAELLDRADAINADQSLPCSVKAIRLYGSASRKVVDDIGDIDAIAELECKFNDRYQRFDAYRAYASAAGRDPDRHFFYAEHEVKKRLRARKAYLSLDFESHRREESNHLKAEYSCAFKLIYPRV
jgi:hypothetical protein